MVTTVTTGTMVTTVTRLQPAQSDGTCLSVEHDAPHSDVSSGPDGSSSVVYLLTSLCVCVINVMMCVINVMMQQMYEWMNDRAEMMCCQLRLMGSVVFKGCQLSSLQTPVFICLKHSDGQQKMHKLKKRQISLCACVKT